jgi:hypothetical protein
MKSFRLFFLNRVNILLCEISAEMYKTVFSGYLSLSQPQLHGQGGFS